MKKNDKIRKDATVVSEAPVGAEVNESNAPKKKRRFTRKSLIKVMFIISIIFIMISLTYSWFTASKSASVKGLTINVTDPNNLVADGVTSKGAIDSVAGNGTSFFKPTWSEQIIGTNGIFNLYGPVKSSVYNKSTDDVFSVESVADNVLVVDFNLAIAGRHNLYMVSGSGVKPASEGAEFLEGAIRVSVMKFNEETQKYELCLVWIPDVTSKKGGKSELDTVVTVVSPDGDATKEESFEISSENGEQDFNGVRYVWGNIGADNQNKVFVGELEETGKYRCVVWLDGNDRECDYELLDKEVVATFMFLPEAISDGAAE
jgi:hypothetical protein